MSGAQTRGPRPVSTQVDGGGVCSSSTVVPPCLLFSLRSCCPGALSPEARVTHFLPAERSLTWTPYRGSVGLPALCADLALQICLCV